MKSSFNIMSRQSRGISVCIAHPDSDQVSHRFSGCAAKRGKQLRWRRDNEVHVKSFHAIVWLSLLMFDWKTLMDTNKRAHSWQGAAQHVQHHI